MSVLEVRHIEKHFGATRVLEDISLSIRRQRQMCIRDSLPPAAKPPCCAA